MSDCRYDLSSTIKVDGYDHALWETPQAILEELSSRTQARLIVVEMYPGISSEALDLVAPAFPDATVVDARDAYLDQEAIQAILAPHVTSDSVRGVMYRGALQDLMDTSAQARIQEDIRRCLKAHRPVIVWGFGASLIADPCARELPKEQLTTVYGDISRWEIQQRYRQGMPNHFWDNPQESNTRKFKRGYFIEWRLADKIKRQLQPSLDYLLALTHRQKPLMISGDAYRAGLAQAVRSPFRMVPYFDPGVWGGQWMREHFGLSPEAPNYAWSFDGVPEENSVLLRYGTTNVEVPAQDIVLAHPKELLGARNYARFGAEFPIRFDLLDTMGGQNLSLQVHPTTDYIINHYGMTYTQDESYYILDAGQNGGVYLGVKEGIDSDQMIGDLKEAQVTGSFDADKYVNFWPAAKHDHFLIPAGTVHCSSADCMVLEISATPYIFTYKLWDWDRTDLDGNPRPIHIEDGARNIQWDRDASWVKGHLINQVVTLYDDEDLKIEKTGLHELEFIETRRYSSSCAIDLSTQGEVQVFNLVEGTAAWLESPQGAFEPREIHYAETVIVPAQVQSYRLRPAIDDEPIKVLVAQVRQA